MTTFVLTLPNGDPMEDFDTAGAAFEAGRLMIPSHGGFCIEERGDDDHVFDRWEVIERNPTIPDFYDEKDFPPFHTDATHDEIQAALAESQLRQLRSVPPPEHPMGD